jgi:hypothetical protein
MSQKLNSFGFNIWNNNNITNGKSNIYYSLGKVRHTIASTTRIYDYCSTRSSQPLYCTFGLNINSSNASPSPPEPPTPSTPPEPPTNLTATPGNGEANIYFTPGSSSGSSISDYLYSLDGINYVSSGSDSSPITISGLTNGVTYNSFKTFAIKIVLLTTDKTSVPYLTDMRCIALPSNINSSIG